MKAIINPTRQELDSRMKKDNLESYDKGKSTNWEEQVRDRVFLGSLNYNRGYEAWVEGTKIVYEPDIIYHPLTSETLTREEYLKQGKEFFESFDIEIQPFDNLLVEGDWVAIRFEAHFKGKPGAKFYGYDVSGKEAKMPLMEFIHYKYNPEPIGPRAQEGWAIMDSLSFMQQLGIMPEGRIEGGTKE